MTSVDAPRRSWVEHVMGLPFSILGRGAAARASEAADAVRSVFAELADVDRTFSPYRRDSVVSQIARGELRLEDSPRAVRELAERCEAGRELTDGLFDATRPDGTWDPSGLVKGWSAERAARHLAEVGDVDWCLNAGGDVWVHSTSGVAFAVGIQDPSDPAALVAAVSSTGDAVATSGTAARGAHLYDPRSATPVSHAGSLTVMGPSLETADVLATAAFIAGPDGLALVARNGYEGLRVDGRGQASTTPGWPGSLLAGRS